METAGNTVSETVPVQAMAAVAAMFKGALMGREVAVG
jgi:hypothetical protein